LLSDQGTLPVTVQSSSADRTGQPSYPISLTPLSALLTEDSHPPVICVTFAHNTKPTTSYENGTCVTSVRLLPSESPEGSDTGSFVPDPYD